MFGDKGGGGSICLTSLSPSYGFPLDVTAEDLPRNTFTSSRESHPLSLSIFSRAGYIQ